MYPPLPYRVGDANWAVQLIRANPFAHLFTANGALHATRIPFVADVEGDRLIRLRAHLDAHNPQAKAIHGAHVLVAFSGPAAYVSPHWRADKTKGGTYDYEEVQIRGTARVVDGIEFFKQLIDDLSALIEPQYPEIGDYPLWQTPMSPQGHIERQVKMVKCFEVEIEAVQATAKLHQQFPTADRKSVAEHLSRSHCQHGRDIATKIFQDVEASATSAK